MKRKILFLLVMVASLALMFSCKVFGGKGNDDDGDNNSQNAVESVIFSPETDVTIIANPSIDYSYVEAIMNAIFELTGRMPALEGANTDKTEHLIVIGKVDKPISDAAYEKIDRYHPEVPEDDIEDYPRYLIYSASSSIAIAYEEDEYGLALDASVKYFVENYLCTSTLILKEGIHHRDYSDVMAHVKKMDEERHEQQWETLYQAVLEKSASLGAAESQKLADDFIKSMKNLYGIYNSDMVSWFANLYEPYFCVCEGECQKTKYCGGGGFYYSNSGRNTIGYLPDTESTSQALGFINSSGMAALYGGSYRKAIGEEMSQQISYYIKNSQASNGFFYNAQWTQAETDAQLSRRARDLNWCVSMLETFGLKPTYDTPNGVKGDGYLADGTPVNAVTPSAGLTLPLGSSSVTAVSKVIAVSNTPAHLKDEESFRAYLATLDIHNKSYPVGNTLTAQSSQIKQTPGLMEILIEWLNEHQNPATGHWDWKVEGDVGYSDYYGVNGLLKISGIYNTAKVAMPHSAEAVQSAIDAITADETMGAVVDLYNTWFSISNILTNLINYSEDKAAGQAQADAIVLSLLQQSPEAIKVSMQKIYAFQKLDGSFSYGRTASSSTSQGMPVAVPGTNEGDVNATVIASTGLLGNIYSALRLTSYKVHLFGEYERRQYMDIIENLQPVEKDAYETEITPAVFDDDSIGDEPSEVDFKLGNSSYGSYVKVVDDPRSEKKNQNVLEFKTVKGSGDYVYVKNNFSTSKATCFVFEGDFCVLESNADYVLQATMGSAYMFIFKVSGGKVNIWDASSADGSKSMYTDLLLAPGLGEWFNLKIEYYIGTHDTVRIMVYYNGDLAAITDNYFNSSGTKLTTGTGTPSKSFGQMNLYAMNGANFTMQMDNLACYCTTDTYTAPTENFPPVNVDLPEGYEPEIEYATFEDNTVDAEPSDVTFKIGDATKGSYVKVIGDPRSENTDNKVLEFNTVKGSGDYVYVSNTMPTSKAKSLVFEGDFCVAESNSDYVMQITMGSAYMFIFKVSGGKVNIWDASSANGASSWDTELCLAPALGEWFNIRIEYYVGTHDTVRIKIYFNNKLAAITDNYYDYSGSKITAGTGTPSKSFGQTSIYAMSGATMKMYVDNLASYCRYNTEYTVPTEDLPPVNVDMPDSPEKIYDFDAGIPEDFTSDASVTEVTVGENVENMLAISGTTRIPVNIRTKGTNCGVTEINLYCDPEVASGKIVGSLIYRDVSSSSAAILGWNLKVVTVDGVKYLALVEAPDENAGATVENLLIPLGTVVKLRIDYYHAEDMAIIYLDGNFVAVSSPMYKSATRYTFGKLDVLLPEGGVSGLYVESIKAERTVSSFDEAVKPEVDSNVVDFTGGDAGDYLIGGAEIVTDSDDSFAKLDSASGSAIVKIPMAHRSKVMTAAVMEVALKVISAVGNGELYRLAFTDENGNIEFALVVVKNGNAYELREGSAGGTRSVALYSFAEGEEIKLRVEIFSDKKIANIYVDGVCVAISSVFYQGAPGAAEFDYVEISSLGTSSTVAVDDLVAETLYKYYVKETLEGTSGNGYVDGVLDFSTGTTGQIPSAVTYSLSGSSAVVRVEKLIAKGGEWSDVLTFYTGAGKNDALIFAPESSTVGSSCVVFEADITFTGASTGDIFQIMFNGDISAATAYMFNLKYTNNTFWMVDCSSTGDAGNRVETKIAFPESVSKGEWFNLRVEYYTGTKDTVRMKTYINGTLVLISDNYYGQLLDGNDKPFYNAVNYVRFYSLGATEGTLHFDNVKLYGTSDKCTEAVTTNN